MSTREIGTKSSRGLDIALVGYPVGISLLGLIGVLLGAGTIGQGALESLIAMLTVVSVGTPVLALLLTIPLMISLYTDASALKETDLAWSPSPILYAIGGIIPLVGYNYLWRRYKYLPRSTHGRVWWYTTVILGGLTVVIFLLGFIGLSSVGFVTGLPAAVVLSGILSAALYMDARFLHDKAAREGSGRLNPANYLLGMWFATWFSAFLPIQLIILAYYANKRRQIDTLF